MTHESNTLKGWEDERKRVRRGRLAYAHELVEVFFILFILSLGVIGAAVAKNWRS